MFLQCSRTCQTGHQMRMVVCTRTGVVVPDDQCDENLRPVSERFCNGHIDCFRKLADSICSCMNFWHTINNLKSCITILCNIVTTLFCDTEFCCLACKDEYPRHCRRLMRTPMGCMGDYARKICCWSCRND